MKTIAFCFVALFAGTFAAPLIEEDGSDPLLDFDSSDKVREARHGDRIIGGEETTIQDHPYALSFKFKTDHLCGGSIISPTRGLTAAHCFITYLPIEGYGIMAGSTTIDGNANEQLRGLNRILRHPEYNKPKDFQNDVAILYWQDPLTVGEFVNPVTLPPQGAVPEYTKLANVTGWGWIHEEGPHSVILRVVSKPLISNEICNRPTSYNGSVSEDMLCAGAPEGGRDTCVGDSGASLVVNNVLFGVSSWGAGCGRPNYPGVYARVPHFTDWISENL